jgi:enamine deaminase RidA (YjgF/YER057c/UK114 family)
MRVAYLKGSALLFGLMGGLLGNGVRGEEARLSIGGYDPVAYFTDDKPVPGKPEFEYLWHDARWRFASADHRDLFMKDPEHYAPQFDGYCALGVAWQQPHKDTVDPNAWAIVDGKLYLTHTARGLDAWRQNEAANIKRADENWPTVERQAEPTVVGPPCHNRPPSVVISFKDGYRQLLVGAQMAVDKNGNIVGKGDMRAQIDQVGKNILACLKAAGAGASDVIQMRAYVTNPDAFAKNADALARYLGPEAKPSTTTALSLSAGSEFLVEIEAVAKIKSSASESAEPQPGKKDGAPAKRAFDWRSDYFSGENEDGTTSMFSCLTNMPRVAGGQLPSLRDSSRMRARSLASL